LIFEEDLLMTWYTGDAVFDTVLAIGFGFTVFSLLGSLFVPAPYGRFPSDKMGVNLSPKFGWWLMELPAMVFFLWFYVQGPRATEAMPLLLALIWVIHYGNRGWFFPLSIRVVPGKKSSFSVSVMVGGMLVTAVHGYLNARFFTGLGAHLTNAWFADPRFLIGFVVYYTGFFITVRSESIMRNLRDPSKPSAANDGYRVPYGGAFRWVTSPQYLGELVAWAGFTLMTWGLPGLMIFLISASNLVPRALATHRWYHERFPDYPPERKALIPGVV
jgi:3-oxo-5-alpha-steroid 4-dehydrogenase 1